jgi:hypothetical protein
MAGPTEHLGLQLDADASKWDAAFRDAERTAGRLGGEVGKLAEALDTTFTRAPANVGNLVKQFQAAEKSAKGFGAALGTGGLGGNQPGSIGGLIKQVEAQRSAWSGVEAGVVKLAAKVKILELGVKFVGDQAKEVFSRAQTDPALKHIDEMRSAYVSFINDAKSLTQDLIIGFLTGIDRIRRGLGSLGASGISDDETNTRAGAISVSAKESAKREVALRLFGTEAAAINPMLDRLIESSPLYQEALERYTGQFSGRSHVDPLAGRGMRDLGLNIGWGLTGGTAGRGGALAGIFSGGLGGDGEGAASLFGELRGRGSGRAASSPSWLGAGVGRFGGQIGSMYRAGGVGLGRSFSGWGSEPSNDPSLGTSFIAGAGAGLAGRGDSSFDRFADRIGDRTTALGAAFDATTAGISAAVDAAITGSDNIGRAWLRASAMALKALAVENSVRALTAGALAVGAAFFAPAAAGGFAKQAAMHAAAAAAAGLGAAALGGMAGGGGGGGGYGGSTAPAGGGFAPRARASEGEGPLNVTVNVHALGVTDRRQTAAVVNDAVHEALAARRTRASSARVTRYGSGV